jgi:HK97 family phage major capsid protein
MAGVYNQQVSRTSGGSDSLVPEPLSAEIIQEMPKYSAALTMLKSVPLSSKTWRMPVLDVLPVSYWVNGDTGLKQTSQAAWKNVFMVVEELATIIPIPEAYLDDADVPLWDEIRPRMAEAAGQMIDKAVFWGQNKPSTWGTDIFSGVEASGNIVTDGYLDDGGGTTEVATDFGQSVTALGDYLSQTGYTVNGFVARPGLNWKLAGIRSEQGIPIFQMNMNEGPNGALYGFKLSMVDNGSWDAGKAQLLAGDFSKAIIGMRQDMSFKLFDQAVISDDSGNVVMNLMQQDAVAMRLVMRLAYATANPVTIMQPSDSIDGAGDTTMRWPFGAIATSGYATAS